jgi:hypothetical protein
MHSKLRMLDAARLSLDVAREALAIVTAVITAETRDTFRVGWAIEVSVT